jgi:hypothetical protein
MAMARTVRHLGEAPLGGRRLHVGPREAAIVVIFDSWAVVASLDCYKPCYKLQPTCIALAVFLRRRPLISRERLCFSTMRNSSTVVAIICFALPRLIQAGYAPREKPKLPEGFCPKSTGTVTDTTGGECRCLSPVVPPPPFIRPIV